MSSTVRRAKVRKVSALIPKINTKDSISSDRITSVLMRMRSISVAGKKKKNEV